MYQNDSEQNDSPKQRGLQTASSPKLVEGEKIVQIRSYKKYKALCMSQLKLFTCIMHI